MTSSREQRGTYPFFCRMDSYVDAFACPSGSFRFASRGSDFELYDELLLFGL